MSGDNASMLKYPEASLWRRLGPSSACSWPMMLIPKASVLGSMKDVDDAKDSDRLPPVLMVGKEFSASVVDPDVEGSRGG